MDSFACAVVLHAFDAYNEGRAYADQIKPFNFLLASYVAPFGHPSGYDPERLARTAPTAARSAPTVGASARTA